MPLSFNHIRSFPALIIYPNCFFFLLFTLYPKFFIQKFNFSSLERKLYFEKILSPISSTLKISFSRLNEGSQFSWLKSLILRVKNLPMLKYFKSSRQQKYFSSSHIFPIDTQNPKSYLSLLQD